MASAPEGFNQIQNIIRRSQALILSVKLLGADITVARKFLTNAKNALNEEKYDSALHYAMESLKEVMRLKRAQEAAKASGEMPSPPPSAPGADIPLAEPARTAEGADDITVAKPTMPTSTGGPGGVDIAASEPAALDAAPAKAEASYPEGSILGYEFADGFSYLIEEGRANKCFVIFKKLIEREHIGLCITRTNPKLIKSHYDLDISEMLWLTDRESTVEPTIAPSLENMIYVAEEFIDNNEKPVLLLDGLEYLISNNTFNSVLRFIRRLIDKISESEAVLLIGVSQLAISEQELKLLEKEMTPIII